MDPASLAPVLHEAGVLEGLHVEGETGLLGDEEPRQVADALLAVPERSENPDAGRVGEGVEEVGEALRPVRLGAGRPGPDRPGAGSDGRHGCKYIHET